MRKNSPRKWLHACLDLLPVILIPVFLIYSHRHDINNGSIQVQEQQAVYFNQHFKTSLDEDVVLSNINVSINNYSFTIDNGSSGPTTSQQFLNSFSLSNGHTYYLKDALYQVRTNNNVFIATLNNPALMNSFTYVCDNDNYVLHTSIYITANNNYSYRVYYPQIYDLTEMGLTLQEFEILFTDVYYPYTPNHKVIVDKPTLTTYDDTDIMSQFTYQLYNAVDKYFNMGNVFGLNDVYKWFNANIFNGSAPIYIYVVWQIVLYEFVMDLLFLLYGLFMWFIDMVQHLMDKPFKSIK